MLTGSIMREFVKDRGPSDHISTSSPVTAGRRYVCLAVEVGDWHRVSGNSIASFGGLTPTEAPSGCPRSAAESPRPCNIHARRLLVVAAGRHRCRYE